MAKNKKNHISEVLKQAENGIREVFEDEKYQDYLRTMGKFHNYSVCNVMLIQAEKLGATYVAGYKSWNKNFGRHVKKGEKGIPIIAYIPNVKYVEGTKKDEHGVDMPTLLKTVTPHFAVRYVYDISQTDGKPLPKLIENLKGNVDNYKSLLQSIKDTSPFDIGFEEITDGTNGYCNIKDKQIKIKEGLSERQTIKTAIHEVAHSHLHTDKSEGLDRRTMEVEAEAVAFATCEHFGLDTSSYSFTYIASWSSGKELKELEESLDRIQHKSSDLITTIEKRYLELNPPEPEINRSVKGDVINMITPQQVLDMDQIRACLDYKIPVGYYTLQNKETGKQVASIEDIVNISDDEFNKNYQTVFKDIKLASQIKDSVAEGEFCYMQSGCMSPTINPYIMQPDEVTTSKFLISEFMKSEQWSVIDDSLKYNAPVNFDDIIKTRDKFFNEKYFSERLAEHPGRSEEELRNLAGYITITDESMDISLPGQKGIWDTADFAKINGNEYFLMYNKEDDKQNVIVDKFGKVHMNHNCNFEDLKDRLNEELHEAGSQEKPEKKVTKSRKKKNEKER